MEAYINSHLGVVEVVQLIILCISPRHSQEEWLGDVYYELNVAVLRYPSSLAVSQNPNLLNGVNVSWNVYRALV